MGAEGGLEVRDEATNDLIGVIHGAREEEATRERIRRAIAIAVAETCPRSRDVAEGARVCFSSRRRRGE